MFKPVPPLITLNVLLISFDEERSIFCQTGAAVPLLFRYIPVVPAARLETAVALDVYIISPAPAKREGMVYDDQDGVAEAPLNNILLAVAVPARI